MIYTCKICKREVKLRRNFVSYEGEGPLPKFPRYHVVDGYPCHGFFTEVIDKFIPE